MSLNVQNDVVMPQNSIAFKGRKYSIISKIFPRNYNLSTNILKQNPAYDASYIRTVAFIRDVEAAVSSYIENGMQILTKGLPEKWCDKIITSNVLQKLLFFGK